MRTPVLNRLYRVQLVEQTHYALVVRASSPDDAETAAIDAFLDLSGGERDDAVISGGFLEAESAEEVADEEEGQ